MKAIFCNNYLPGQIHFRGDVMNHFHRNGWEIVVVVPENTATEAMLSCLDQSWKRYLLKTDCNSMNPINDLRYLNELRKIYRKERPDIVFHYTIKPNIYGTIAARMAGVRNVAMVAGLGYMFDGNSMAKCLGRALYRFGLGKADRVFALNESNCKTLLEGNYVKQENLIHLKGGEGVNLSTYPFRPMHFNTTRFLMVARVLYDKGYSEYVESARIVKQKYPEVNIELLGPLASDSPMGVPEEVVMRDHENGAISYLGETDDVQSFVLRDGVVVVVVSKYLEGLNRSLMEACAMGRPIITTTNPGCKETVDNGVNGFLVAPENARQLADAMIRFIELPAEDKIRMSEASHRKAVEIFDVKNVIRSFSEVTETLTGKTFSCGNDDAATTATTQSNSPS